MTISNEPAMASLGETAGTGRARAFDSPAIRYAASVGLVAVLLIGRRPGSFFHPQLWAEDGPVFYGQAILEGALRSLFEPHAGYLQILPRAVSIVATHLPAAFVPFLFALVAFTISTVACSAFAATRYRTIVKSDVLRLLVCCAIAIVPPAHELIGTLTNLHWYLALLAFFLLIGDEPAGTTVRVRDVVAAVTMLIAGLSAPETLIFLPLAIYRALQSRSPAGQYPALALFVGLAAQVVVLAHSFGGPDVHTGPSGILFATLSAFIYRDLITAVAGQISAETISAHAGAPAIIVVIAIAFAVACTLVFNRLQHSKRTLVLLFALAFVFIALAIGGRGLAPMFAAMSDVAFLGERYFFLPTTFLMLSVAIALEAIGTISAARAGWIFCGVFAFGALLNYRVEELTNLNWAASAPVVDRYVQDVRRRRPSPQVVVPINPSGWNVALPART